MRDVGKIDLIRASHDGHAFHHAWAARSALELLPPNTDLEVISIEGFPKDDEELDVSNAADEIADLVRYRGGRNSQTATRIEIVQFKYSIAKASEPMRAAAAAKTIRKFAAAFQDYTKTLGAECAREVVRFELVTNRTISPELTEAIVGLGLDSALAGEVRAQADAVTEACGLSSDDIRSFATMLTLSGGRGALRETVGQLARTIASWSSVSDSLARTRLLALQRLVTDKVGSGGQLNNSIVRVDVLGALEIEDERDLFPTEAAFPPVERVITRQATNDLLTKVKDLKRPLLVHGVGGMGKTVLMQSLGDRLSASNLVVVFDGFGAGRWRDPEDGRHLPERALLQIINQIASKGLCDLLLPGGTSPEDLIRTFRRRLEQAVATLREQGFQGGIVLLLDAIDHSAMRARDMRAISFAALVLETFSVSPLDGVLVVGSCRTERLDLTKASVECELFKVPQFSQDEATTLVLGRYPNATPTDIAAAYSRSGGNPRILQMVLRSGPPFEVTKVGTEPSLPDSLDVLIGEQVKAARDNAKSIGATDAEIATLLAGLALLPPPVPPEELAAAQGMQIEEVESFVADLFPLIEQTPHGLIFRDEPTETFIREQASQDAASQTQVLSRLDKRQVSSSYAARAYPAVLRELGRKAELFALAFDDRLPATATSGVAQRAIRIARLEAALHVAATDGDVDQLLRITLELARISEGHGRSDKYLRDNPDLVAISQDPESLRRLFEDRGSWPGGRHASLAVANLMDNDEDEARRNARRSLEWNDWRANQPDESRWALPGGRPLDVYGPGWVAVSLGRQRMVCEWLLRWEPSDGFARAIEIVRLIEEHAKISQDAAKRRDRLYRALGRMKQPPTIFLLAVLSGSRNLRPERRDHLIRQLISATEVPSLGSLSNPRGETDGLRQAIIQAATRELLAGRTDAARALLDKANLGRPSVHTFDRFGDSQGALGRWLLAGLVRATVKGQAFGLAHIAPSEIEQLIRRKSDRKTPDKYLAAVTEALKENPVAKKRRHKATRRSETRESLRRFIDKRTPPIIHALARVQDDIRKGDAALAVKRLLDTCERDLIHLENYPYSDNRRFAHRSISEVAFQIAGAMDVIDVEIAERIRIYLETSEHHYLPDETAIVWMLASHTESAPPALKLASALSAKLGAETSVDTRIGRIAALARAVWPASIAEAKGYFIAGLQLADSFSSDDIDETYGLLALAEAYRGSRLAPGIVHEFQRLCEMQMPEDEDRYDWRAHAFALARIGGLEGLANSCRLNDRGRGGIRFNHLMMCAALTEVQTLNADLSALLIGLYAYTDWLVFGVTDYLEMLLPKLSPKHRSIVLGYAASEVDRIFGALVPSGLAKGLNALGCRFLAEGDPIRDRFSQLADEPDEDEASVGPSLLNVIPAGDAEKGGDPLTEIVACTDIHLSEGIDVAVAKLNGRRQIDRPVVSLLKRLAAKATLPEGQIRFLDAVEQAQSVSVADKLVALDGVLSNWIDASVGVRTHVPLWAKAMAARHAVELSKGGWDGSYWQGRLVAVTGGLINGGEIAIQVLKHLSGQSAQIGRKAWLGFARQLVDSASSSALADGLCRYVTLASKAIPNEFADGPWSEAFEVADDQAQVVAGLLWSQLGSPNVRTRWRAAHAVRRSAELDELNVLAGLMERINSTDAGAYHDRTSNFHFLSAKLWLLLAVARIALEQPECVLPYRQVLEGIAFSTELPHVLMRQLAARALISISTCCQDAEGNALRKRCGDVNNSAFAPEYREHYYGPSLYENPPAGHTKPERDFHFDYDFTKYQVGSVARVFGSHQYEIGDKIAAWVHRWSPDATSMWSGRSDDEDRWSGGREPVVEGWNGHLAWHGLFLAAGEMLLTHPVVTTKWERDPWAEWINNELLSRDDGRWLADDTSITPIDVGDSLTGGDPPVPARAIDLLPLANLDRPNMGWIVVEGSWETPDDVAVSVYSAAVPEADLQDAAFALSLMSQHDVWLPLQENVGRGHTDMRPCYPWLTQIQRAREDGIDASDPYASKTARCDVRPTGKTLKLAGLEPIIPFQRTWKDGSTEQFTTEAWGRISGRGRYEKEISGGRSWAHRSLVQQVCTSNGSSLVVLIFTRRYLEKKRGDAASPSRWLVVMIGRDGKPRPVTRIPGPVRKAVKAMPSHPRSEFRDVIKVVRAVRVAEAALRRKREAGRIS